MRSRAYSHTGEVNENQALGQDTAAGSPVQYPTEAFTPFSCAETDVEDDAGSTPRVAPTNDLPTPPESNEKGDRVSTTNSEDITELRTDDNLSEYEDEEEDSDDDDENDTLSEYGEPEERSDHGGGRRAGPSRKTKQAPSANKQGKKVPGTHDNDKSQSEAKSRKRHQTGIVYDYREAIPGAPPPTTDLPWAAMSGITSTELLAFFPSHALRWPALAARLIEDGWTTAKIARFINDTRGDAASNDKPVVLANTIGISITKACQQYYDAGETKLRVIIQAMQFRTDHESRDAERRLMTKKWQPLSSKRYRQPDLEAAWTLKAIGAFYFENGRTLPCLGKFTQRVLSAYAEPEDAYYTISNGITTVEPMLAVNVRTGRAYVSTITPATANPPALPTNWNSPFPLSVKEQKKRKRAPSPTLENHPELKRNHTADRRLNTRNVRVSHEELSPRLQNDPDAIISEYPHLILGELLLWLLSKNGGCKTVTEIHRQLIKIHGKKKVIDRSTLAKRKSTALQERANKKGTTYQQEVERYDSEELHHQKRAKASKRRSCKEWDEDSSDEEAEVEDSSESLEPCVAPSASSHSDHNTSSQDGDLTAGSASQDNQVSMPQQDPPSQSSSELSSFKSGTDMPMTDYDSFWMTTPELEESIKTWMDANEPHQSASTTQYSGAGLGLDVFDPHATVQYTEAMPTAFDHKEAVPMAFDDAASTGIIDPNVIVQYTQVTLLPFTDPAPSVLGTGLENLLAPFDSTTNLSITEPFDQFDDNMDISTTPTFDATFDYDEFRQRHQIALSPPTSSYHGSHSTQPTPPFGPHTLAQGIQGNMQFDAEETVADKTGTNEVSDMARKEQEDWDMYFTGMDD